MRSKLFYLDLFLVKQLEEDAAEYRNGNRNNKSFTSSLESYTIKLRKFGSEKAIM